MCTAQDSAVGIETRCSFPGRSTPTSRERSTADRDDGVLHSSWASCAICPSPRGSQWLRGSGWESSKAWSSPTLWRDKHAVQLQMDTESAQGQTLYETMSLLTSPSLSHLPVQHVLHRPQTTGSRCRNNSKEKGRM